MLNAVTVRLIGGLGNQMFAYAAGRALAMQRGAQLRLDPSCIGLESHRKYELDSFQIAAKPAGRWWVPMWLYEHTELNDRLAGWRFRSTPTRELHFHFDRHLERAPRNPYLIGYWQSERYFQGVAGQIRRDFTPRELGDAAEEHGSAITRARTSVAVHVRRGDYVDDPTNTELHGVLGLDYYAAAARLIAQQVDRPQFFVLSDEPEWCEENLNLPGETTFVSGATAAHEDIHLMSLCDHAIIANSSFSWWGAWLGETPGSVVVAPKVWFEGLDHDTSDLVPARWLRA